MAEIVPSVTLNNGVEMPQLGFGVFQIPDSQVTPAVLAALECGYRSIDTAAGYENESGVGKAIASSGIPREEIFVTTKLANDDHGYQAALRAFDESLRRLDQDYVDLYLIHWPIPAQDLYVETWRAFEKIYADRRARSIGVSNLQPARSGWRSGGPRHHPVGIETRQDARPGGAALAHRHRQHSHPQVGHAGS